MDEITEARPDINRLTYQSPLLPKFGWRQSLAIITSVLFVVIGGLVLSSAGFKPGSDLTRSPTKSFTTSPRAIISADHSSSRPPTSPSSGPSPTTNFADSVVLNPPKTEKSSGAQVSPTPSQSAPLPSTNLPIVIHGDAACVNGTQEALSLIQAKAVAYYTIVLANMKIIECINQGSGIYAYENLPRYVVGDATRNAGPIWYAGTIVHDAEHSKLYHDYQAAHPGEAVPSEVWTGQIAEAACLDVQASVLSLLGADQSTIDYVLAQKTTNYWDIPYSQRWW